MSGNDPRMSRDPLSPPSEGSSQRNVAIAITALVAVVLIVGIVLIVGALNSDDDGNPENPLAGAVQETPNPSPALAIPTTVPTEQPDEPSSTVSATEAPGTEAPATATPSATTVAPAPTVTPAPPTVTPNVAPTATTVQQVPTATPVPPPPEPTSEVVKPPTAAAEPPIGEYGELPPPVLPSGGAASTVNLSYQLGMSLESLPAAASVYSLQWPVYTLENVQAAAERLGLMGPVAEEGVGIYRVESARGSLYVSPNEIIFRSAGFGTGDQLPDNATAISSGREWLSVSGFVGSNLGSGVVTGRDPEAQRVVVMFRPVEPSPNLAPTPSATLNIGPGNVVLEARIHWPNAMVPSEYGLRAPINMWQAVQNGHGYLEADLSNVDTSSQLSGTATITDYSIAFTLAGTPANQQYLVPLIMFHGTARLDQTGQEISVSVAVPAVYHEASRFG